MPLFERRKHARFRLPGISTEFGEVVNFSETGFAIFRKGALDINIGGELKLAVAFDGQIRQVTGKIVRLEELAVRRWEIGLELTDLTDADREWLRSLADRGEHITTGPRVWLAA